MNLLDKAISYFSPQAALDRARARRVVDIIKNSGERRYEAASTGRRTNGWYATDGSANSETARGLHRLRNRSRDLVRNNPWASKAITVIENNTIGAGIRPSLNYPDSYEKKLKEIWSAWGETTKCDFAGRHNFYGLQDLAMRSVAESGECIIRKRRGGPGPIPIQLQVSEADVIDTSKNVDELTGRSGYIIQGVEFDSSGRRVAYWLYDRHPADSFDLMSKRVPAEDVIHLYQVERPGQVRGVPWGAPAMLRLRDFDDYEDAQLMRQKIAACFSVFVTDQAGDSLPGDNSDKDPLTERVEPGIIQELAPGQDVSFADPPGPGTDYKDYSRNTLLAVAAGYGVTYEALTGDLSGVNFSSGRMGWLEFHRNVTKWQKKMFIPVFCETTWDWFENALEMKGVSTGAKGKVRWIPPRREMIDPVKETKALALMVRNGFISWQEAVRERGADPDDLLEELKKDADNFDKYDLQLDSDPRREPPEGSLATQESNTGSNSN